ncbi:MAG: hypothetical protein BWY19_00311 [bacterium ADurb.Bin212]|nr:MAG: hypothetical protein BWY19_00311 [bacterium ADurb.Bin212]
MKKFLVKIFKLIIYIFAIIGFVLTTGYFAVRFGLTDIEGSKDINNTKYENFALSDTYDLEEEVDSYEKEVAEKKMLCAIDVVSNYGTKNAKNILDAYNKYKDQLLIKKMLFAVEVRLGNSDYYNQIRNCQNSTVYNQYSISYLKIKLSKQEGGASSVFPWSNSEEWEVVKSAILKDKDQILSAGNDAGVDPRIILSVCLVEQFRLYNTQREFYEQFFKPLQILGNANKMAWGVMSIKEATAIKIENNLKDRDSDYYLGPEYENLLDFDLEDKNKQRYDRLTDEKNHYYSYLYGSLYLKQIMTQWSKKGYNINSRPEILGTLFNLGFGKSEPKKSPVVGGTNLEIGGENYTFGSLTHELYFSGELEEDFPLKYHSDLNTD